MADAGWNTDPTGRHELRYWSGSAWTAHVSDAGVTSEDPVDLIPHTVATLDAQPHIELAEARLGAVKAEVIGGSVELTADGVLVLTWKGIASSREQKKSDPRAIEMRAVRAVQAHEPGKISNGWIRFGPDVLPKVGSQPPKDFYSVSFARSDRGYTELLQISAEVCRRVGTPNPLPEPVEQPDDEQPKVNAKWADLRPDIGAAASRMEWTFGGKREIKKLEEHLYQDEVVEELAQGTFTESQGIVALTNQRLLFLFHGLVSRRTEEFSVGSITAVEISKMLNLGTLRLRMSGNSCEISQVISKDLERMASALRRKIATPIAVSGPVASLVDDPIALIKKLGELKEAGLLSSDEYEAKKQELLQRL